MVFLHSFIHRSKRSVLIPQTINIVWCHHHIMLLLLLFCCVFSHLNVSTLYDCLILLNVNILNIKTRLNQWIWTKRREEKQEKRERDGGEGDRMGRGRKTRYKPIGKLIEIHQNCTQLHTRTIENSTFLFSQAKS